MRLTRHIVPVLLLSIMLSACGAQKKAIKASKLTFEQKTRFEQAYFEAIKLKVLGDFTGAGNKFADALKIDPVNHAAMYQMANLNMGVHSYHEAIYWAEKSIKFNPNYNFWYFGQLAQAYSKAADYTKSAETFKTMVNKEPDRRSNYIEAGNQFINARALKDAVNIFNSYEKRFGVDEESARKKEGLYFEMGKPKEAVESVLALVKTSPNNVQFLGLLAEAYIHSRQLEDAIGTYNQILQLSPDNGYAYFGLADVYRKKGEDELSFTNLSKAFDDKHVSADLKIKVIGTYYVYVRNDEKMREQALILCEKLIENHPTETEAYIANSDILYAAGMPEKARQSLKVLTQIDPGSIHVWQKILSLDDELDNMKFLEADSWEALDYFPNHTFLYIINAFANYTQKNYAKAAKVAELGLEISVIDKDRVDLLNTLGDAQHSLGEHEKSDLAFDELLELDPQNDGALNNYAYYLSLRTEHLDKALKMIKTALQKSPDQATYIDTHGWILFQMNAFEEAVKVLRRAYDLMPNEPEVVEHYAKALIQVGETEKGNALMKRVQELNQTKVNNP